MENKKVSSFNWLLVGYIFLGLMTLPYLPIIALQLPLVMNEKSWMKSAVESGPFMVFWLLILAGVSFFLAGLKQNRVYYVLSITCFFIIGLMLSYYLLWMRL